MIKMFLKKVKSGSYRVRLEHASIPSANFDTLIVIISRRVNEEDHIRVIFETKTMSLLM